MAAIVAPGFLHHPPTRTADRPDVAPPVVAARPVLRGRLHQLCAAASVPAGIVLVGRADSGDTRLGALVFAVTWTLMFTTSACYHRLAHTPAAVLWMRRADHSTIFVHIAGAQTPLLLSGHSGVAAWASAVAVWGVAVWGVALKTVRLGHGDDAGSWLYPVLGALPLVMLPTLGAMTTTTLVLLLGSGAVYAAGAVCFFRKWPDPLPAVFGYHEVWHVFTLAGGLCQFAMTWHLTHGG